MTLSGSTRTKPNEQIATNKLGVALPGNREMVTEFETVIAWLKPGILWAAQLHSEFCETQSFRRSARLLTLDFHEILKSVETIVL
jgi:hypothetical protein